jgi:hypothetical protein
MYRSFQRYELELLLSLAAGIVSSGGAGLQAGKERTFSSWCVSKTTLFETLRNSVPVTIPVSNHRGSNSQVIDFARVEICPIFTVKIEHSEKSNT